MIAGSLNRTISAGGFDTTADGEEQLDAAQGLTSSASARRSRHDRKTIRAYIARGVEAPAYKPRGH